MSDDDKDSDTPIRNDVSGEKGERVVTGRRFKVVEGGKSDSEKQPADDDSEQGLADEFNTKEPQSGKIVVIGTIFAVVALGLAAAFIGGRKGPGS